MIRTVEEHQQAVLGLLRYSSGYGNSPAEELPLQAARGRVLAQDVAAPVSLPPFDNSQMDGYAVHAADLDPAEPEILTLRVAAPVAAGAVPPELQQGWTAPIMTGAMMPEHAAAVVPIEQANPPQFPTAAQYESPDELTVTLPGSVLPGDFIRRTGSDIAAGTTALTAGTVLGPAQLGLLAACGLGVVPVRPRFSVLLLTTGDEVQEPGSEPVPGKIFDANTTLLETALEEAGARVVRHQLMNDNPALLREVFGSIDHGINLVLTTGGISQGAYEVVKQALADSSVEFLPVAMQPGGPQAIGTIGGTPFLGFPGNPVSALVSFEMFLRPALGSLAGIPAPRPVLTATLTGDAESPEKKHQVRRGLYREPGVDGQTGTVELLGGPGSHLMHALAGSNALVQLPVGISSIPDGTPVSVWLVDGAKAGTIANIMHGGES